MRLTRGAPRSLDDTQVRRVLRWHASREHFLRQFGTLRDFAEREAIPLAAARRWLRQSSKGERKNGRSSRHQGRPGILTRLQRLALARWQRAYRRYLQDRPSAAQLARELGVSRFTVFDCIKRAGRYAQRPSSEVGTRSSAKPEGRPRRQEGQPAARGALLTAWPIGESRRRRATPRR